MRIPRTIALLVCAFAVFFGATVAAQADKIRFSFSNEYGIPYANSTPGGGFFTVVFTGKFSNPISGSVERGNAVIASTPSSPPPSNESTLEANLQPGDVAVLNDVTSQSGYTATFSGYPTVEQATCGDVSVSGATAPGQPVVYVRYDTGFGSLGAVGKIVSNSNVYTATFPKPLPEAALIYATSFYTQPGSSLEVETQVQVRATGPCPPAPLVNNTPAMQVAHRCVVPNLKHKSLKAAKRMLAKAHCKLGKVRTSHKRHKLLVKSQLPAARKTVAVNTKVNIRLG